MMDGHTFIIHNLLQQKTKLDMLDIFITQLIWHLVYIKNTFLFPLIHSNLNKIIIIINAIRTQIIYTTVLL